GDIFWRLIQRNFIYVPSVLVRRRHFEEIGLFSEDVPGTEDWDAWLRLAANFSVQALHEPVGVYRDFSPMQMSANRPKMCKSSARTQARALRSHRASEFSESARHRVRSEYLDFLWRYLTDEARRALSQRNIYYAATNYGMAAKLCPRRAIRSSIR